MATSNSTNSCELSSEFLKIAEICTRIEHWASKPSPPDSPLIELVKNRLHHLVISVECLLTHPDAYTEDASTYVQKLCLVKQLLSKSLYLLDLCAHRNIDLSGDDGAINAVFASMSIMGGPRENGESVSDKVKRLRLDDELMQIISPWFGPNATRCNRRWGLQSDPLPIDLW